MSWSHKLCRVLVNSLVEEAEVWRRIGVEFVPQEQGVEGLGFRGFHPAVEPCPAPCWGSWRPQGACDGMVDVVG
jgi:hypothetical protein